MRLQETHMIFNCYITIIKEKRTALNQKRVPLNQNGCTADFRIGVPFVRAEFASVLSILRTFKNHKFQRICLLNSTQHTYIYLVVLMIQ